MLLRALGYSTEEPLNYFYDTEIIHFEASKKYSRQVNYELLVGQRATRDIKHPKTKEILVKKNRKFTKGAIRKLEESGVDQLPIDMDELSRQGVGEGRDRRVDFGEVLLQCNEELSEAKLDELRDRGVEKVEVPSSTTPTSVRTSATRCSPTSSRAPMKRSWRSIAASARVISRRSTRRRRSFTIYFSTSATTCRASVVSLKLNYKFKIVLAIETHKILTKRDTSSRPSAT